MGSHSLQERLEHARQPQCVASGSAPAGAFDRAIEDRRGASGTSGERDGRLERRWLRDEEAASCITARHGSYGRAPCQRLPRSTRAGAPSRPPAGFFEETAIPDAVGPSRSSRSLLTVARAAARRRSRRVHFVGRRAPFLARRLRGSTRSRAATRAPRDRRGRSESFTRLSREGFFTTGATRESIARTRPPRRTANASTPAVVLCRKGCLPRTSRSAITPTAKRSAVALAAAPRTTSGAAYAGVPAGGLVLCDPTARPAQSR